ncbi:hypothetical protein ABT340_31550 [Streptosporangium sp. NPDC000239]|uniref:hypothetical protein n=1 Tax=Streptosporangium sp. NPDC000239 TaxID=3154248 RepID=UPI003325F965
MPSTPRFLTGQYRAFVRERSGVVYDTSWTSRIAEEAIREAAHGPADLINPHNRLFHRYAALTPR